MLIYLAIVVTDLFPVEIGIGVIGTIPMVMDSGVCGDNGRRVGLIPEQAQAYA